MEKTNKGFTLVELLVVIAIIGLLTGMVVASIQNAKAKSRDAQRISDINSLATALAFYHNDFNEYPIEPAGYYIDDLSDPGASLYDALIATAGILNAFPLDPKNSDNYRYYYESADGSDFYLEYYLETNSMSGKDIGLNYLVP